MAIIEVSGAGVDVEQMGRGRDLVLLHSLLTDRSVFDRVAPMLARTRLAKRNVDVRALESGAIEKISGDKVKRPVTVKVGIPQEKSKQIQKLIKDSKLKVAASIQGDAVRISGAKKDELQSAIQLVRKSVADLPLQFINFRD